MLRCGTRLFAIVTIVAFCGVLSACKAETRSTNAAKPTYTASPETNAPLSSTDNATQLEPISSIDVSIDQPGEADTSDGHGVGAAAATSSDDAAGKAKTSDDRPFDPVHPTLLGIALYDSDTSIAQRYGDAFAKYVLPGDGSSIDIWEYAGYVFGFDTRGRVVYIEITSGEVSTGIAGLRTGMPGAEAADLLEISYHPESHVLNLELDKGWLKVDLDPDSHEVLSIKLIGIS